MSARGGGCGLSGRPEGGYGPGECFYPIVVRKGARETYISQFQSSPVEKKGLRKERRGRRRRREREGDGPDGTRESADGTCVSWHGRVRPAHERGQGRAKHLHPAREVEREGDRVGWRQGRVVVSGKQGDGVFALDRTHLGREPHPYPHNFD